MKIIDLQEARKTQRRPALDMGLIRFGEISMSSTLADYNEVRGRLHILTKTYLDITTAAEKAAATAKLKNF